MKLTHSFIHSVDYLNWMLMSFPGKRIFIGLGR